MMKTVDVLNLEWTSYPSRDRQMATLVCNYLRHMGFGVYEGSVFNGYYLINNLKPKVIFITNTVGAGINIDLIKYAKQKNICSISLISEGNFPDNAEKELLGEFVWGWNKDRILYEDIHMQWTDRTRALTIGYFPELEGRVKVSGAVGFDVYRIALRVNKNDFLNKYNKGKFKSIIGVGCWDFGIMYPSDPRFSAWSKYYNSSERERFISDQNSFNEILRTIVENNPQILFLLKEHPGCLGRRRASAIEGLDDYENSLIIRNEESIIDCIGICDFWINYESTTAIEAWLLGKQTCLLNPSGTDFPRANVYQGSPNFPTIETLQNAINQFYENGELPGFNELDSYRDNIIKDTIQWDDGLNHVRAGNEIIDILEQKNRIELKKDTSHYAKEKYKQMILWYLSPYLSFLNQFKFYAERVKAFNEKELRKFQQTRLYEQKVFYERKGLQKKDLRKIRCI